MAAGVTDFEAAISSFLDSSLPRRRPDLPLPGPDSWTHLYVLHRLRNDAHQLMLGKGSADEYSRAGFLLLEQCTAREKTLLQSKVAMAELLGGIQPDDVVLLSDVRFKGALEALQANQVKRWDDRDVASDYSDPDPNISCLSLSLAPSHFPCSIQVIMMALA